MEISLFDPSRDLVRLEVYLRELFCVKHTASSWLPERLHDLLYRVGAQEKDEGRVCSADYIYLWEENGRIIACLLPDGENIYISIRDGYEHVFPSMTEFSEKHCLPLFTQAADGSVKIWLAVSDDLPGARNALEGTGYQVYAEKEYMNCLAPSKADISVVLPDGYKLLYGEEYPDEVKKWSALRLGFHPDWEAPDYTACMNPYRARKNSSMYPDCFECLIVDEKAEGGNNVCSYCFVYVDRPTGTALIEPVSTREKYRHKGLGTAMIHGAVRRCKELGIEKCYVDSFGSRKDFYASAGFSVESSISFWYKMLHTDA